MLYLICHKLYITVWDNPFFHSQKSCSFQALHLFDQLFFPTGIIILLCDPKSPPSSHSFPSVSAAVLTSLYNPVYQIHFLSPLFFFIRKLCELGFFKFLN